MIAGTSTGIASAAPVAFEKEAEDATTSLADQLAVSARRNGELLERLQKLERTLQTQAQIAVNWERRFDRLLTIAGRID